MVFQQLNRYFKTEDFVAIDFETATKLNPCQIGIAIVKGGEIVQTINRLIRPPHNYYDPQTISVHHITPDKTDNQPEFPEVWNDIKDYFDEAIVVAHNARFDMSVLQNALDMYYIPYPHIEGYICTCDLNDRERLELACARYGIILEHHHDGEDDAVNCAKLYLAYLKNEQKTSDEDLPKELFQKSQFAFSFKAVFEGHEALRGDVLQKDLSGADPNNPFFDRKVVITGVFDIDRIELANRLKSMGADIDTSVSSRTNYLLIGNDPGPSKIKKFEDLIAVGKDVRKIYQNDLNVILSGRDYEKYHTVVPLSKPKDKKPNERKTTWPQLVEKFQHYIEGANIIFSEQEIQSEDYRLLSLYYKQQQTISTTKSTVLNNLRQLNEDDEYIFRKEILECFSEDECISKDAAYKRMQTVFSKYGLQFKAKTCVLNELGVKFEEYKVKGIHHLRIISIPKL